MTIKEAQQALQDAHDERTAAREGRAALAAELEGMRYSVEIAAAAVQEHLSNVVRSDPATETLIHDYQVAVRTAATLRQALDVIAGMLPEEHKFCRACTGVQPMSAWRAIGMTWMAMRHGGHGSRRCRPIRTPAFDV